MKFAARLILFLLPLALLAAPRPEAPVLERLHQSEADWRWLRDHDQVQFASASAELRYQRALRRLQLAIRELEDGTVPGENFRGRAVVSIQQNVSSTYVAAAIATLPAFVTEDDFGYVDALVRQVTSSRVADLLGAYYHQDSDPSPENRRGQAARALVANLSTSYLPGALSSLGAFLSGDDADFVSYLVQAVSSSRLTGALTAYQTHPSRPYPGSRKGVVGRIVVEAVSSSYLEACLAALPDYVHENDVAPLRDLVAGTSSSRLAEALRQFFATR